MYLVIGGLGESWFPCFLHRYCVTYDDVSSAYILWVEESWVKEERGPGRWRPGGHFYCFPCIPGADDPTAQTSKASDYTLLFMKNWGYLNPLFSPVSGFEEQYFWVVPCVCFHSCLFVFRALSLHSLLLLFLWSGLPPCCSSTPGSFLLQINSPQLLPTTLFFSACRCAALFSKISDPFLGCSEWDDIYLAIFKGGGKLRVAPLLHHLNLDVFFSISWLV